MKDRHRLERLETRQYGYEGHGKVWACWECRCGAVGSGYRFSLGSEPPLVQAANEWAAHCVAPSAFDAGEAYVAKHGDAPDRSDYVLSLR
jgi:hypothetical protein